jgi:hypothetical protein
MGDLPSSVRMHDLPSKLFKPSKIEFSCKLLAFFCCPYDPRKGPMNCSPPPLDQLGSLKKYSCKVGCSYKQNTLLLSQGYQSNLTYKAGLGTQQGENMLAKFASFACESGH